MLSCLEKCPSYVKEHASIQQSKNAGLEAGTPDALGVRKRELPS
jgi:hypothetical protein